MLQTPEQPDTPPRLVKKVRFSLVELPSKVDCVGSWVGVGEASIRDTFYCCGISQPVKQNVSRCLPPKVNAYEIRLGREERERCTEH